MRPWIRLTPKTDDEPDRRHSGDGATGTFPRGGRVLLAGDLAPVEDGGLEPGVGALAWGGEESNRFGTDEYLAYCAELGTEP